MNTSKRIFALFTVSMTPLFLSYHSSAYGQITAYVDDSDCRVLVHAGCPMPGGLFTADNIDTFANDFKNYLEKYHNEVAVASSKHYRPGYSCDHVNLNEDVATILDIKILPPKERPCIGLYTKDDSGIMKQIDLTIKNEQILGLHPDSGFSISHGYLCSPLGFINLINVLRGQYGRPFLICTKGAAKEKGLSQPANEFSPKDPDENYAGTPCEAFTRPAPKDGTSIYGNDSIVVYGARAYRCETQGGRKIWTLYGPREKLGKDWKQYEAGRLEN